MSAAVGGARRSAALVAGFALGFLLAYLVAVVQPLGQELDASSFGDLEAANLATGAYVQEVRSILPAVLVLAAAVLAADAVRRGRLGDAVRATLVLLVAGVLGSVLKDVLARPFHGEFGYLANTFPSGHVAVTTAALAAIAALAPPVRVRARLVGAAGAIAVVSALASLVGYSHRPSDLVGGACLAVVCAGLAWWGRTPRDALRRCGAIVAVMLVGAVLLVAVRTLPVTHWVGALGWCLFAAAPVLGALAAAPRTEPAPSPDDSRA